MALAHFVQNRRRHLGSAGDLSPAEREALRKRFALLAAKLSRRAKTR
jgi:hypothetical protein